MTRSIGLLAVALLLASCGGEGGGEQPDAPEVPDAPVDSEMPPPPSQKPAGAVSAGAGRVTGGPWTVDVQIGAAIVQRPAQGGGWTTRSAAPIAQPGGGQ